MSETDTNKIERLERENETLRARERMRVLPGQVEVLSTAASSIAHRLANAMRCEEEEQIVVGLYESARATKRLYAEIKALITETEPADDEQAEHLDRDDADAQDDARMNE